MWDMMMDRLPTKLGFLCLFLAYFVPYVTYKVNQNLHKDADPPWKKEERNNDKRQNQPSS
ncbi:hypothetical protein [Oceanobacillus massiliensis]|uniref:hypothetical protein n=1 Tax=Oceanobacillus massiliensis TaxID=1465765 RepID=UPI000289DF0F|nr:hypothetical protein [Oceanobacillus massiliensis]